MKQLILGIVIGAAACAVIWSQSTGEAHAQVRGGDSGGVAGAEECLGDLDGDGSVGVPDLLILLSAWGPCPCPDGLVDCNGTCVDTTSDPNNCGGCNLVCDRGDACIDSACAAPECTSSSECDDGNACTADSCENFQCVFTPADGLACDDGSLCTTGDVCKDGVCVGQPLCGPNGTCIGNTCVCDSGYVVCSGQCVDTQSNNNHCGVCNAACPPGTLCENGICALALCVDHEDCPETHYCQNSLCVPKKPAGEACTGDFQCISDDCFDGICQ